jgi:hypothetical protein
MQTDSSESNPDGELESAEQPAPAGGSRLMFWILFALAVAAFAPCVLLPEWRDYQAARVAEEVGIRENARLRVEFDQQQRTLDAVRNDPAVIERLAIRELAYGKPGEVAMPVAASIEAEEPAAVPDPIAAPSPPAPIERVLAWVPFAADDNIFCDPSTRRLIMGLCGALLVSAFILFPPRRAAAR